MDREGLLAQLQRAGFGDIAEAVMAPAVRLRTVTTHPFDVHPVPPGERACPTCRRASPVEVEGVPPAVVAVAAGWRHALALTADGAVVAWGANESGQLGDGTRRSRRAPVPVLGLDIGVIAIAAGISHSVALTAAGTVLVWGFGGAGQLGLGAIQELSRPAPVELPERATAVFAREHRTLALLAGGTLMAWGGGFLNYGLIGDGSTESRRRPVPVAGLERVRSVVLGNSTSFAIDEDGQLWAWGANDAGELGDGTTDHQPRPVPVRVVDRPPDAMAAGGGHNVVVRDGVVSTWGRNAIGQLGDGTTTTQPIPVELSLPARAIAVVADSGSTLVVLEGGHVAGWGVNRNGQLGDGTLEARSRPVPTEPFLSGVTALSFQWTLAVALTEDGRIFQWGGNEVAPSGGRDEAPVGSTKFGGEPDLPAGVPWPAFEGEPQAFVAQVRLSDAAGLEGADPLPPAGLLSFFFSPSYRPGYGAGDVGAWVVLFTPDDTVLARRPFPDSTPDDWRFPETPATVGSSWTVAEGDSRTVMQLDLDDDRSNDYFDFLMDVDLGPGRLPRHWMLGHPSPVQGSMQHLCEAVAKDLGWPGAGEPDGDGRWLLLLQVGSDAAAGIEWGDVGTIYYWITQEDLSRRRFHRVWCIVQEN